MFGNGSYLRKWSGECDENVSDDVFIERLEVMFFHEAKEINSLESIKDQPEWGRGLEGAVELDHSVDSSEFRQSTDLASLEGRSII